MDKQARITQAQLNHRLFAFALDLIAVIISTAILFLIILYGIFGFTGYYSNKDKITNIENELNLNLEKELEYSYYEEPLANFYFNLYSEEIVSQYNSLYNTNYSITHIYNINVLNLPATPTFDNYKTEFYQYTQNEDGSFDTEELGIKIVGSGNVYEKNMSDIFYNSYIKLKPLLQEYNDEYYNLTMAVYSNELSSRIISSLISIIIFYFLIPLIKKNKCTLFEAIFGIAKTNCSNGYIISWSKAILRPIILYTIPFIGFCIFSKESIVILSLGFIFINLLLLLLSKRNVDLPDLILRMDSVSVSESLVFRDEEEELAFLNTAEGKKITEASFLDKLASTESITTPIDLPDK